MSESDHQQVWPPIVVKIQPERGGGRIGCIVSMGDASLFRYIGEREVVVIVIKVIAAVDTGVCDKHVVVTVAIVVGYRDCRSQSRIAGHNVGIGIVEGAIGMTVVDSGCMSDVGEPGTRLGCPEESARAR